MRNAGLRLDQAPPLDIPLRFFLTAPLFGVAAGVLLLLQGAAALTEPLLPSTLALTHLLVLGWVTQVMVGALYQIVPVLVGVPVPAIGLGRWVHGALTAGVVALALGLALTLPLALAVAAVMLVAGLGAAVLQVAVALTRQAARAPTPIAIGLALFALAVTTALGVAFVLEHVTGRFLAGRTSWVAVHAVWGLAGWAGLLLTGVGFGVLPMFYLAPPFSRALTWSVIAALAGGLLLAPAAVAMPDTRGWLLPVLLSAVAWSLFAVLLGKLRKTRRRKVSDPTLRLWIGGMLAMGGALSLLGAFAALDESRWLMAFGCAYVVGGVISIELGMLYKIVPFLVWLHRFSPHVGKTPVPMVGDILSHAHAGRQAVAHGAAAILLTAAALLPWDGLVRLAGFALAVSFGYAAGLLWRAARFPSVAESAALHPSRATP